MAYGVFQAYIVANAMQGPALSKWDYADDSAAITPATLAASVNSKDGIATNISDPASNVSSVTVQDSDPFTSVIFGSKAYTPAIAFMPAFTIKVGQVINRNLLQAANSGTAVVHPATAWVPGGTPVAPPW